MAKWDHLFGWFMLVCLVVGWLGWVDLFVLFFLFGDGWLVFDGRKEMG